MADLSSEKIYLKRCFRDIYGSVSYLIAVLAAGILWFWLYPKVNNSTIRIIMYWVAILFFIISAFTALMIVYKLFNFLGEWIKYLAKKYKKGGIT